MADKPILVLSAPSQSKKLPRGGGPSDVHFPSPRRQVERLRPVFEELRRSIRSTTTTIQAEAYATEPEQVLVLQTVGAVEDFIVAIHASGMDWLGEFDSGDVQPDDDFFDAANRQAHLGTRMYLVMANQISIGQMLRLWDRYQLDADAPFPRGSATLKTVFGQLKVLRRWNAHDRLSETNAIQYWRESLQFGERNVRFEIELFFRRDQIKRNKAFRALESEVAAVGGRCVGESILHEIAYHGVLVELPSTKIKSILEQIDSGQIADIALLRIDDIMFVSPGGQTINADPPDAAHASEPQPPRAMPRGSPIVALLDGLPLSNHPLLAGRVIIDDPDGWEAEYPADRRCHGTAMASLILHGDLDSGESPLTRPIYARPIMRADTGGYQSGESIPDGILPIDLTLRAVRRMFRGENGKPAAPNAKIINLSIGDSARHFLGKMSAWARLIDWLAWEYRVLFIISAGNHTQDIHLELSTMTDATSEQIQEAVLKAVASDVRHRKLLAPAESINGLTVGAVHADASTFMRVNQRHDPYTDKMPCPFSGIGPGYRRAVKPDVLFSGGRAYLVEKPLRTNGKVVLTVPTNSQPPGQKVAHPGGNVGDSAGVTFTRGTSNAAALATRCAAQVYENLLSLRREPNGEILEERLLPIICKGLLVHGARWGETFTAMKRILSPNSNGQAFKEQISRFIGYGVTDPSRIMDCVSNRATLIGCGSVKEDEANLFKIPLPRTLSGRREFKRLVITLAWLSPINPKHFGYRRAALWFSDPTDVLKLDRQDAQWQAAQRGTVQHAVFEGDSASVFSDGEQLTVQVNCRSDAGTPRTGQFVDDRPLIVPYALLVSLEVAEGSSVPVYQEIRDALQIGVRIRSAG